MGEGLRIIPATKDRWEDFEKLFGPSGACYGCWCMHWRQSHAERAKATSKGSKALIKRRFVKSPPPGVLAFEDETCVGWVQVTRRAEVPRFNSPRASSRPLEAEETDDRGVWAITCFFFLASHRGKGLSHQMVRAAVDFARQHGAKRLEACPMQRSATSNAMSLYVGSAPVFVKAGFTEVARRIPNRPLMRLDL
ncbi:MAG: GNAT family N-acetyltransferase [Cucumibacter sp.]